MAYRPLFPIEQIIVGGLGLILYRNRLQEIQPNQILRKHPNIPQKIWHAMGLIFDPFSPRTSGAHNGKSCQSFHIRMHRSAFALSLSLSQLSRKIRLEKLSEGVVSVCMSLRETIPAWNTSHSICTQRWIPSQGPRGCYRVSSRAI